MIISVISDLQNDFGPVLEILELGLQIICVIVPIILVIMVSIDFVKAVVSNDDGALKKAFSKGFKRLAAGAIIFLIPFIVSFVMQLVQGTDYKDANVEGTYHPIIEQNHNYL
ncbi:MAG: hypothetical protein PHO63_06015 [Bacilli bacterium]|nr:hypothetical protein [Bacilli bacterium]MDD4809374.1 hypothetical protein [Bacilli bacterium]